MRTVIKADDGDQITLCTYPFSPDELIIRMELDNSSYGEDTEFDWITLSAEQARRLGYSLLMAADRTFQYQSRVVAC